MGRHGIGAQTCCSTCNKFRRRRRRLSRRVARAVAAAAAALCGTSTAAPLRVGLRRGIMDAWSASLQFSRDADGAEQLLDSAGTQVMMEWERPWMVRCVDALRLDGTCDVLEVGFGCGYSATRIQHHRPRSHTIVECAPAPLARLAKWAEGREGVVVVEGTWQERLPDLGAFDAVFFDDFGSPEMASVSFSRADYRAMYEASRSHLHAFVEIVLRWHARDGCRISGYLVQPISFPGRADVEVSMARMPVAPPAHCHYYDDRTALVPLIVKRASEPANSARHGRSDGERESGDEAPAEADEVVPGAAPSPGAQSEASTDKKRKREGSGT